MRAFMILILSIVISFLLIMAEYFQHPIIGYEYYEDGDGNTQETAIRI